MKVAIIGGGVVGVAIGIKLYEAFEAVQVSIFEKEHDLGMHASSRNSGVLHSGLYYSPESLKAKFSKDGNLQLRKFIKSKGVPLIETGKLILTKNESEIGQLEKLADRADKNGVPVEMHDASKLSMFQSGARTVNKFLFSPLTAVSDPKLVFSALQEEFIRLGGRVEVSFKISASSKNASAQFDSSSYDWVINSAGAGALQYAQSQGVGNEFTLMPFLGRYWGSKKLATKLKVPLYPVPHPINPFLGVHLTPTSKGIGKIGPTAIPVLGAEQYGFSDIPSAKEIIRTIGGAISMMKGEKHSLGKMIATEARYVLRRNMIRDASALYPNVVEIDDWDLVPGGIRSQLINKKTGALLDDFLVESRGNTTHILNAVSPGWTSALSFAEWIIREHSRGK
jgi:L-2-hydroxyglutarate oxidase LhgO